MDSNCPVAAGENAEKYADEKAEEIAGEGQAGTRVNGIDPERERELIAAAQSGCTESRNILVEIHRHAVVPIAANRYSAMGDTVMEDIRQEAIIGMMDAIRTFQFGRKTSLRTHMTNRARGAVKDYLRSLLPPGGRRKGQAAYHVGTIAVGQIQQHTEADDDYSSDPFDYLGLHQNDPDAGLDDVFLAWDQEVRRRYSHPVSTILMLRARNVHMSAIGSYVGFSDSRIFQILSQEKPVMAAFMENYLQG